MALAYDTRRSTSDVYAVFVPTAAVRAAARRVAERLDLDMDWLNDGAKAFVPGDDPITSNVFEGKYLRVAAASPRFLLAMKLLSGWTSLSTCLSGNSMKLKQELGPRRVSPTWHRSCRSEQNRRHAELCLEWRTSSESSRWIRGHPAAINLVGPAFVEFEKGGHEELGFIAVQGGLDRRSTTIEGKQAVEFSWQGFDEGDEVGGRGWAALEPDGNLSGHIYFGPGDDSGFRARRR